MIDFVITLQPEPAVCRLRICKDDEIVVYDFPNLRLCLEWLYTDQGFRSDPNVTQRLPD